MLKVWEEMTSGCHFPSDKIWCQEVIIATTKRNGDGTDNNPIRIVTQVFTKEGCFIAEYDPHPKQSTTEPVNK